MASKTQLQYNQQQESRKLAIVEIRYPDELGAYDHQQLREGVRRQSGGQERAE